MSRVKFGDVVKDCKEKIDRNNNPYDFYVAGDHMDTEDLVIRRKGRFATDDVGPAFIRLFRSGQVLYGSRRTYLKKVAVADFEGVTANTTFVLETKNEEVLRQRLLPFIMLSDSFTEWSIKRSKGSTNPYVLFSDLAAFEFDLPCIELQDKYVGLLWSLWDAKEAYRNLLAATDELVKARFVEMFGDPESNPQDWREDSISNVILGKVSNGFFAKKSEYNEEGNVSVLGVSNVVNRMYSNIESLPKANGTQEDIDKYSLKYGDILFCRSSLVAEGIGKASIVPECVPEKTLFECHVIRLQLDTKKVVPEYIQVLTTLPYFRNQVLASAKTVTMTTIGQEGILKCRIIIPPYKKQKDFLAFTRQLRETIEKIQVTLAKANILLQRVLNLYIG